MQPKGRLGYVYDSASNQWVPWEGTAAGYGGVSLFTTGGIAFDTTLQNSTSEITAGLPILGVAANAFFVRSDDSGTVVMGTASTSADAQANALASLPQIVNNRHTLFNGTTWDRARGVANNADAVATSTLGIAATGSYQYLFNGATFDRWRSTSSAADAIATATLGIGSVAGYRYGFNGTTWDRVRSGNSSADALATSTVGIQPVGAYGFTFNGTTFDRLRSASAATQALGTKVGVQAVAMLGGWTLTNAPAANTQATATQAAGGAAIRHILTAINATLNAVAAITAPLTICVRDGASGAGAILWQDRMTAPAGVDSRIVLSGLAIVGSANTAMTVEFTAAPGALNFETLNATGYAAS